MFEMRLPEIIDDGRLDWALTLLHVSRQTTATPNEIRLNWSKVHGISPAGMAILCCILDTLVEQHHHVKCLFVPKEFRNIPVVQNLTKLNQSNSLPSPDTNDFESADMMLKGRTSIDILFRERFLEKFAAGLSEDVAYDCLLILNELMQNTVDHSTAERYYLYAGRWNMEFHVGVLDMGITIPAKMEQRYHCADDLEYLKLALKEGTTTRRRRPGGVGLSYFFNFIKRHGGKLTVMSRGAQVRRYFSTRKSQKTMLKYPLQGTWCFARFPLEGR